jgi:hypothetical protein
VLLGIVGGIIGWNLTRRQDPRMATRILWIGIAISVVAISLSVAIGVYTNSVVSSLTSPPFQITTTTVPTITLPLSSTLSGGVAHSWTVSMTASGGYSATAELEVGNPAPYQLGLTSGDATAGSACSLTAGTDAVIPAVLVMTNTSANLTTTLGADFSGIGQRSIPSFTGPELIWEANYSGGPQCAGQGNGATDLNVYSLSEAASGTDSVTDGFFDITNYYSSSLNGGGSSILGDTILTVPTSFYVTPSSNGGSSVTTLFYVSGVTGPGVLKTSSGWEFTLAGTAPPTG